MARGLFVIFGGFAYLLFLVTFLYMIGFLADAAFLPRTIDRGPAEAAAVAIIVDLALIALFGLQHSIMARPGFKTQWTRIVPQPIERSAYVVLASCALIALFAFWRPLPAVIWQVEAVVPAAFLWTLFAFGWAIVLVSSYLINHFELFGLAQVWRNLRGRTVPAGSFRTPLFYALVRHPLYSGFLIAFWATPLMTAGHLLFALAMTAYILVAIRFEESDLVDHFGSAYVAYRRRVGMLIPRLRRPA